MITIIIAVGHARLHPPLKSLQREQRELRAKRSALQRQLADVNRRLGELGEPHMIVEELWGARLYTGPLFVKYNGVLRGISSRVPFLVSTFQTLCQGNQYTTCVASWLRTSQTAGHVTGAPCHSRPVGCAGRCT